MLNGGVKGICYRMEVRKLMLLVIGVKAKCHRTEV